MKSIEHELRQWMDKAAIQEVAARYSVAVDSGDADGFAQVFSEDIVWEWPALGLCYEGREALRDLAAAIAEHLPGGQHVISNHVINLYGEEAEGVCELTCFISRPEKIYTVLQGFYWDRYRKVDGRWYICRRNVEVVNPEIITKGAIGELYRELTAYLAKSSGA